jgi:hypothetical protein
MNWGKSHFYIGHNEGLSTAIDHSFKYFSEAFKGALDKELKNEKIKAAQGLYEVHKARNQYAEALKYHEVYAAIKDTILNQENIK